MRQGMLTLSGAHSTTSHLDIYILSIFHYLGSHLGYYECTLMFDLMRNLFYFRNVFYFSSMYLKGIFSNEYMDISFKRCVVLTHHFYSTINIFFPYFVTNVF